MTTSTSRECWTCRRVRNISTPATHFCNISLAFFCEAHCARTINCCNLIDEAALKHEQPPDEDTLLRNVLSAAWRPDVQEMIAKARQEENN